MQFPAMALSLSPLIRRSTSTWAMKACRDRFTSGSTPRALLPGSGWGVLPVSVPRRATLQNRGQRLDLLPPAQFRSTAAIADPDPRKLSDVLQGVGGDHGSQICEHARYGMRSHSVVNTVVNLRTVCTVMCGKALPCLVGVQRVCSSNA